MPEITILGSPSMITDIIGAIKKMNREKGFKFSYSMLSVKKQTALTIMAPHPEDFLLLGAETADILKEAYKNHEALSTTPVGE